MFRLSVEDRERCCLTVAGEFVFLSQLSQSEIEHLHVAVWAQHDVFRLDVPMDNARFMCGDERSRNLLRNSHRVTKRNWPLPQSLTQSHPFDVLHRDEAATFFRFADLINHAHVWMIQR